MVSTRITDDLDEAAQVLSAGGLVAFPTETVYGLGVDATNESAIERLFAAKGRPSDNPLIVHIGDWSNVLSVALDVPAAADQLMQVFSPGPLTVVLTKLPCISMRVTAGLNTVGVRIPGNDLARQLLVRSGRPIAAPSANRSGRPSCTTWRSVLEDLDGRIDLVLRGPDCEVGIESTVVDCTHEPPTVLRAGHVTLAQLQQVWLTTRVLPCGSAGEALSICSPGTRHAHYQPKARVQLFDNLATLSAIPEADQKLSAVAILCPQSFELPGLESSKFGLVRKFETVADYAQAFYEMLREADRMGLHAILLQVASNDDVGRALLDRQQRAAGAVNTAPLP